MFDGMDNNTPSTKNRVQAVGTSLLLPIASNDSVDAVFTRPPPTIAPIGTRFCTTASIPWSRRPRADCIATSRSQGVDGRRPVLRYLLFDRFDVYTIIIIIICRGRRSHRHHPPVPFRLLG